MISTYLLVDPSVEIGPPKPFYVGVGISPTRPFDHFKYGPSFVTNSLKRKMIQSLLDLGCEAEHCIRFFKKHRTYEQGLKHETMLIKRYGTVKVLKNIERGFLTNCIIAKQQNKFVKRMTDFHNRQQNFHRLKTQGYTNTQIAKRYRISRERVRQILQT